ncbi:TPA: PD-(D/E)XK nuclease-like domain-containing protein [Citrobacter freundii]|uniref:RecE family exodeoxyribonuclease n=1 Tax=Citrobacter freundii TaxID=546 RepID=UPI0028BF2ED8|nr:RecE family exodeoxyribonuclease [Citrobacter freundii]MDU2466974.1 RecE family exodeoxyribonuclease [Veillonella sp.]MDT7333576.1 RecE family exodeoxyribonuclease [Citrobacter freundii]HEE0040830.1 PD-(D/E)XK nuclease-like domain-containing protein [Citrobacter freundii]HEE9861376.1 PD-(D/E)XK nuclease-like domain-containing protein [Citrobacter freundii]HEE9923622.1 PD-(D/E)XK nuclease-like domain-containing protein [Citrobacter freundii]
MEFFYVVKATQKSGKQDAVIWFTAKTEARANLQLDVALEDAGIETGRGKDYAKPIRTDFPVVDDLPEEGEVDFTWCDRYELQDDGRTWLPKAAGDVVTTIPADVKNTDEVATSDVNVSLENRTPAVRFAFHLMSDKYQTHVTKEQQLAASEMSLEESNTYLQNLLQVKNDVPEVGELSLNAEWKMIQAIKDIFEQGEEHEPEVIAAFMSDWVNAEAGDRNQLVEDWRSGKFPLLKTETTSVGDEVGPEEQSQQPDQPNLIVVATLPFRQRVLAQFIGDGEYLYHVDAGQKNEIVRLEMDTDDTYIQNLLLAAENVEAFKKAIEHDIHKVVNAVKKVFPVDGKKPELATVILFLTVWFKTEYIDRGLLAKEWQKGNRVTTINRTPSGASAGGGIVSDRKFPQTILGLEHEIALALRARDREFDIYNVPLDIELQANSIMNKMDDPEWLATRERFVSIPGGLDYSRACIIATVKTTPEGLYADPVKHQEYLNRVLTETDHANPDPLLVDIACGRSSMPVPMKQEKVTAEEVNKILAASRGEYVEGISDPTDPKWITEDLALTAQQIDDRSPLNEDTTSDVQMEETVSDEEQAGNEVQSGESSLETGEESHTGQQADVNQNTVSVAQNSDSVNQTEPVSAQTEPETQSDEPAVVYPAYFEPGRYEGLPNEVYHAANGISSTQVKDARVSLMYFNARHVAKTITKERSPVLDMGNLVHGLALQPEQLDEEFSVEPMIPEGAFTTTATIREFIDEYNASLPAQLSADDIKALLEEYNTTLPAQVPLGGSVEETGQSYMSLPEEYQRIEADQKQTAAAMKACIKEYNATLPAQVKTSGSRDALLEQLAIINPDLVAQEAQKQAPLKVSGTKADLIQAVKSVNPEAVFADELLDAWRENPHGKVLVTRQQLSTALSIQKALLQHPTAGKLLTHPSRAVEVSYFGFDDETGLEVRVRPDLEIDLDGVRIGADLKTISMWNIKQEGLRAKLHREIIDRDYHLSAAMYCETAALDQFFWIFVNKDENYHWIAIIEASAELLELGMLEYRKAMSAIATGFDTGEWPAPITADYTDELNDFDLRRLEALRTQA